MLIIKTAASNFHFLIAASSFLNSKLKLGRSRYRSLLPSQSGGAGLSEHRRSALNGGDVRAHYRPDPCRRTISRIRIRRTISVLSTTHPLAIIAAHLLTTLASAKPDCLPSNITCHAVALRQRRKPQTCPLPPLLSSFLPSWVPD